MCTSLSFSADDRGLMEPLRGEIHLLSRADAPDLASGIIRHEQGTVRSRRDAYGPAVCFKLRLIGDESGQDILERSCRLAIGKGNKGDFVTHHLGAIP